MRTLSIFTAVKFTTLRYQDARDEIMVPWAVLALVKLF